LPREVLTRTKKGGGERVKKTNDRRELLDAIPLPLPPLPHLRELVYCNYVKKALYMYIVRPSVFVYGLM
jgi:hypothetical protein